MNINNLGNDLNQLYDDMIVEKTLFAVKNANNGHEIVCKGKKIRLIVLDSQYKPNEGRETFALSFNVKIVQ